MAGQRTSIARFAAASVVVTLALSFGAGGADTPAQQEFTSPNEAIRALVAAAGKDDQAALLAILGPGSEDIVSSGDPVSDRAERQRFASAADVRTRPETLDSGAVIFHLGRNDWPFAIPLVKDGDAWRFDTDAGHQELLNRRIGRNELNAISASRAYVDAQREYASRDRTGAGARAYAQKIWSNAGERDGLYWDDPAGTHPSPLGPLVAQAESEGYGKRAPDTPPQPYHGYFYRILTAQGPHAPGGERSYLKDGRMTGGFALVAYPAEHGASGVMTFIVGPEGIVYQKDLGEQTEEVAKAMTAYDPDESWVPVRD